MLSTSNENYLNYGSAERPSRTNWDTVNVHRVSAQVIRHGPVRGVTQRNQCERDLAFLKANGEEEVIDSGKIMDRTAKPEYFNELIYPTDTIFERNPNPQ